MPEEVVELRIALGPDRKSKARCLLKCLNKHAQSLIPAGRLFSSVDLHEELGARVLMLSVTGCGKRPKRYGVNFDKLGLRPAPISGRTQGFENLDIHLPEVVYSLYPDLPPKDLEHCVADPVSSSVLLRRQQQ